MNPQEPFFPIEESYWVIVGRFRAGAYPGTGSEDESRQKIRWLLHQDTNVILDLTEEGEIGLHPYEHLLLEESAREFLPVAHKRLPIKDFTTPDRDSLIEILDVIDLALSLGRNVYLHCYGGKGRTGTVVGCYLVRHGLAGEKALDKIQALRKNISGGSEQSPETEGQKRMVLEWTHGQ